MKKSISLIPYPSYGITLNKGFFSIENPVTINFSEIELSVPVEVLEQNPWHFELVRNPASYAQIQVEKSLNITNPEGYEIDITEQGIKIYSFTEKGTFYAFQTLKQLMGSLNETLQCCYIKDEPALSWRGLMIDVARSFCPLPELYHLIDIMALCKLNILHLHLTDDQGWRFPVPAYPELVDKESGFYTKDDLVQLVSYACKHQITVVPEIDMPGHFLAALSAYPKLSCTGGPFSPAKGEGIFADILCVGKSESLSFAKLVIDQICEIFPSPIIHLGGDEIPLQRWGNCPDCQMLKQDLGLIEDKELLRWFYNKLAQFAHNKERRLLLWSDYIDISYDPSIITQVWNPLIKQQNQGDLQTHQYIRSDYFYTYLDMEHKLVSLSKVYNYGKLLQQRDAQLIGSELMLWTEYLDTQEKRTQHIFPRLFAGAEAFWTSISQQNYKRAKKILENNIQNFIGIDASITAVEDWDPPKLVQMKEIRKRRKKITLNSKKAGIVL